MKTIKYLLVIAVIFCITVPAIAGNGPGGPGGSGGEGDIPDTGELYGDLYVILRDVNGVPILSADGCIQPIAAVDGSVDIATENGGTLTITTIEGEPFALPTYTDTAGDLVECELTEEMATWVQAVDFGRLNLGRSPESVIAHAFDEAIKKLNVATAIYLDPAGRLVLTLPDTETEDPEDTVDKTIDAPAENLALYIEMMTDGDWITEDTTPIVKGGPPEGKGPPPDDGPSSEDRPVLNESASALLAGLGFENLGLMDEEPDKSLNNAELTLAASLLAAAADKTGGITLDKVAYINSVYGINQTGTLPGEVEGKTYYDFSAYAYNRNSSYGNRGSQTCIDQGFASSYIWVLQPEADTDNNLATLHFVTTCMDLLGYDPDGADPVNAVHFTEMVEGYTTAFDADGNPLSYSFDTNIRAFTKAADDALQVIEYIHNYKIPEILYP